MTSARITEDNPALATLRRSWVTAVYTSDDGIAPMGSLHEAGDALVALALMEENGPTVLGSGVMIGPGLVVAATHVLAEFTAQNADPVLLTFLPDGARAWLPRERSTLTGPSIFEADRRIVSDVSLLSCTLNSEALEHHPLTLAPLQISLPLVGERLWAFGYRHDALQGAAALITPLVTSGVVTAVFPQGRGERMPSACIEVAMDTKGGMSGGPVVNANGDLVGIVSSSFDGGPSYVTLIWEALRIKVSSRLPSLALRGEIDLFAARDLGLVKLKGKVKRSKRGNVTIMLSEPESELMAVSANPESIVLPPPGSRPLVGLQLEDFEERWPSEVEAAAADAALAHLKRLELPLVRSFLSASDVPEACLASICEFTVEDFEGLENPDLQSAREDEDGTVVIAFAFDLLSVVWTMQVPASDYLAQARDYDSHFMNITVDSSTASMELVQRCHFEATLTLEREAAEFTKASITFSGVIRPKPRAPRMYHIPALNG
ncbi:S1 family peptidase [Paralcaligenes ureilyticus]|uniref:Trypsin-like peptidase n=1 Tax=Paralcaligenes ureilyticus TaxID=627131 RepID=A0A4R3MFF3_9BURK|nr:serine protease [Paralcaligenes ureilyticus]TCT11049.1 trypsin-like peptidase [Paralcaligenes ureilyticus]